MLFFPARSNPSHYWRSAAHSWVCGQCLRSESERREPPLGRDSCHQYVFHFMVTNVVCWCLNLPCSITSPVKASGWCLVSRRRQGDLPSKYHAPKLQMLAKMQSLSLKHWQNAVSYALKMLRFWFSFTKATKSSGVLFAFSQSVIKMCKDLLSGARWQRWCLIRDELGLGVLALCKGVKETTWIVSRPWDEALQKKGQLSPQIVVSVCTTQLWTQRGGKGEHVTQRNFWCKVPFAGTSLGSDLHAQLFPCSGLYSKPQLSPKYLQNWPRDNRSFSEALQRYEKSHDQFQANRLLDKNHLCQLANVENSGLIQHGK